MGRKKRPSPDDTPDGGDKDSKPPSDGDSKPPMPGEGNGHQEQPKKKSDKTTVSQRIEEVLELRLRGSEYHDIVHYGSQKGWGVTGRQIRKYIRKADELLTERLERRRRLLIGRHVAQRQSLYALALSIAANSGDCRSALAILDSEAKLRGLFPDTKEVKELMKLAEGLRAEVEELKRRLSKNAPDGSNEEASGADQPGEAD